MTTESNDENHHQWVMETLQHYERKLLRYAKRLLGGDEDGAQDIVQHAFLKLCQQDRNEIGGRVAPWLYLVCRNKVLDQMRKQKRMESTGEERERAIVGRETDPGQSAEKQDLASQMKKIVLLKSQWVFILVIMQFILIVGKNLEMLIIKHSLKVTGMQIK